MYQGQQMASTQVRDRRHGDGQWEAPTSMLAATTDRQVGTALRKWHLDPLISDAVLIASELVTNAISHGTTATGSEGPGLVELTWSYQISRVICVITDRATEPPVMAPADTDAESGHGLRIVAALAAAWGWTMLGTGEKAVWAALHLPAH